MSDKDRDRLDGTEQGSPLMELFLAPGRAVLWFLYMFPGTGYHRVRMSARHARSPIMTFIYSLIIWGFIGFGVIGFLLELTLSPAS